MLGQQQQQKMREYTREDFNANLFVPSDNLALPPVPPKPQAPPKQISASSAWWMVQHAVPVGAADQEHEEVIDWQKPEIVASSALNDGNNHQ